MKRSIQHRASSNWLSPNWLRQLVRGRRSSPKRHRKTRRPSGLESLESRSLMSADPLPVLLVIADQQDFYYREYGDTRLSLEEAGVEVQVAATTTNRSVPHANTGEPAGTDGGVTPDIALSQVNPDDYSAIVFVGGWGSSMYQYAFPGDYQNNAYDGDLATKATVNGLIEQFQDADKHVAAICHGVTVLAWARVDGVSPLAGKTVSVPYIGSPPVFYQNTWYGYFQLGQYEQVVDNGAIANTASGQYGDPNTVADDVVVDGRIITAENYDSAREFGRVIAREVYATAGHENPPAENQPPVAHDGAVEIDENTVVGAAVGQVNASDPDVGQTLSFAIVGGNVGGAFAIDNATGQITVANPAALDFESTPEFLLQVLVTDDAANPLGDTASVTVQLRDVFEAIPGQVVRDGEDIVGQGTSGNDIIYVWSGTQAEQVFIWINGNMFGPYNMSPGGHVRVFGGAGNDNIFATDLRMAIEIRGEGGHDLITGGSADDLIDGGDGYDRISGMAGDDILLGGAGDDHLNGMEGSDILVGGDGNDSLDGGTGRDILIGGLGGDYQRAGGGDDILIGGTTAYDNDVQSLGALRQAWLAPGTFAERVDRLLAGSANSARLAWGETVFDDATTDIQCTGADDDLLFANAVDAIWTDAGDRVLSPI